MMTQTVPYDAPAVYLPRLIEWAESGSYRLTALANVDRRFHRVTSAAECDARAAEYREIAERARTRLTDLSAPTMAVPEEPPARLAGFVGWLRSLIGHLLPWVTAETWQTCASLMLMDRERQRGAL